MTVTAWHTISELFCLLFESYTSEHSCCQLNTMSLVLRSESRRYQKCIKVTSLESFLFIHWVHSLKTLILKASGKPQVICKLAVEDFTSETMICLRRVQEFQKTFPQKYLGFLGRFEHRYNRSTESQYWILDEWGFRFFTHVICFVNLLSFSPIDGRILSLLIINEAYLIYFKRWMKFQVNRHFLKFGATFSIWIWLMLR